MMSVQVILNVDLITQQIHAKQLQMRELQVRTSPDARGEDSPIPGIWTFWKRISLSLRNLCKLVNVFHYPWRLLD